MKEIEANEIRIYEFPDSEDDEDSEFDKLKVEDGITEMGCETLIMFAFETILFFDPRMSHGLKTMQNWLMSQLTGWYRLSTGTFYSIRLL